MNTETLLQVRRWATGEETFRDSEAREAMQMLLGLLDDGVPPTTPVLQEWVCRISLMQQSVLISAVRGPDGMRKRHPLKMLLRWYRRCILLSAFDRCALTTPDWAGGGSFTGPSIPRHNPNPGNMHVYTPKPDPGWPVRMAQVVDDFMDARDEMPSHAYLHFMHAFEIVGYKHPDEETRTFWNGVYVRMVHALHAWPETEEQMDDRLGDTEAGWRARNDPSTTCTD